MDKKIEKTFVDWDWDEDSEGRYKFTVRREDHDFAVGDHVVVRYLVDGEEKRGTVTAIHDDGIVLQIGWVDITDDYTIEADANFITENWL